MLSLFIEVVQYVFALGATDVDDIILNLIGGFIGLIIFKIAEKIFKDDMKIKKAISILSLDSRFADFRLIYFINNCKLREFWQAKYL